MSEGTVHVERNDAACASETQSTQDQPPQSQPMLRTPVKQRPWPSWFTEIGRWRADVQR